MKEVEAKRDGDEKVKRLEMELKELEGRYEGSLQLLGEKSEQVEELKADVEDVKGILREVVERSTK